jgi:hypothetical protein
MEKDINQRLQTRRNKQKSCGTFLLRNCLLFRFEIETYFHYGSLLKGRDLFLLVDMRTEWNTLKHFPDTSQDEICDAVLFFCLLYLLIS